MADDLLKLKWNGHIASFLDIFQSLRAKSRYTDVTLACEGRLFTVHRLVLASCSQFFDHIFEQTPSDNTVIVLNEAKAHDIEALLDYMYCGQVDVHQSDLSSFIRTAKCLQIKGLAAPEDEAFKEDKIIQEPSPQKRRRSSSSSTLVSPLHKISANVATPSNRSILDVSPKSSAASSSSTAPKCWIFHQSDLPNTTWSSSPNSRVDDCGTEKENSAPEREYIDNNLNHSSSNKNLVIDETSSRNSSPSSYSLNNFRYPSNLPTVTSDINSSYKFTKDQCKIRNKYCHQSPDCSEVPLDFKKEIKDEIDDKASLHNESQELSADYDSNNYSGISEYDDSSEALENYVHQLTEPSSAYKSQSFINSSRICSLDRPILPLKFVKKVVPMTVPSSAWRNCPVNSVSDQDSYIHPVMSSSSSHSTVSPKLMPYAKCSNCHTNNTKLWRRSLQGEIVCNACGLYFKLHGVNRPSHLFRNAPMTRRRNPRKKKRNFEEILDGRETDQSTEDISDAIYGEVGCNTDTPEELAMLNAALTLNSLLAKAKAQGAANKNLEHQHSQASSSGQVGCDSSSTTNDSLPPPPPLLKISRRSGISNAASQHTRHIPPSPSRLSQENHAPLSDDDPQSEISPNDCKPILESEQHSSDCGNEYPKSTLT